MQINLLISFNKPQKSHTNQLISKPTQYEVANQKFKQAPRL